MEMDDEDRRNRFKGVLSCVRDLVAGNHPENTVGTAPLAYLFDLLRDEAELAFPDPVSPRGARANDD